MTIYQRLYLRMYTAISLALEKAEEEDWASALAILREAQEYTREQEHLRMQKKKGAAGKNEI